MNKYLLFIGLIICGIDNVCADSFTIYYLGCSDLDESRINAWLGDRNSGIPYQTITISDERTETAMCKDSAGFGTWKAVVRQGSKWKIYCDDGTENKLLDANPQYRSGQNLEEYLLNVSCPSGTVHKYPNCKKVNETGNNGDSVYFYWMYGNAGNTGCRVSASTSDTSCYAVTPSGSSTILYYSCTSENRTGYSYTPTDNSNCSHLDCSTSTSSDPSGESPSGRTPSQPGRSSTSTYSLEDVCINKSTKTACETESKCIWNSDYNFCSSNGLAYIKCGDATDIPALTPSVVSKFVNILKTVVPIVLIIFSIISLVKSITAGKEDEIKKAQSSLIRKIVISAFAFFIITIIQFVMLKVADSSEKEDLSSCLSCFLNGPEKCGKVYYKDGFGNTYDAQ